MLLEVRKAIADAVTARLPDIQVSPYMLANPTPPAGEVVPARTEYDKAMARGMDTWTFTLRIYFPETMDIASQQLVDQLIEPSGAKSIKEAVEYKDTDGAPRLGGLVFDVCVTSFDGYRRFLAPSQQQAPMLGAEWTITVEAAGGG
jgi:hypothetical protein